MIRTLPERVGKKNFFFGNQKKYLGRTENLGSVGKQQTNIILILAWNEHDFYVITGLKG